MVGIFKLLPPYAGLCLYTFEIFYAVYLHMQVRVYDVASMSCSYVLAGHTEIVVCIDTCVSSSGKTLIVTGSKDNTVSCLVVS